MSITAKLYKAYLNSPEVLKKIVGYIYDYIPTKVKYGDTYFITYNEMKKFEFISKEEIKRYQDYKFIEVVRYAYNNIEFYKKRYDDYGVNIVEIKGVEDLHKLPLITKDDVIENIESMIPKKIDKTKLKYITTGGTSGKPMGIYTGYENEIVEWAHVLGFWSRIGYKLNDTRAVFRGKKLPNIDKGRYWHYDNIKKELSISTFHMNNETMLEFYKQLNKYKPKFFHGYMSAIVTFTKFMQENNLKLDYKLRAVLATSENIYEHQIKFVESYYETRIFSFYGHSERLIFAGECEYSRKYHVNPIYGIAEIVDSKGRTVQEGELGELVGTGFTNKCMPLIRYKTGDIASFSKEQSCKCGRNHKLIEKVEGRWKQEMLVKEDGTLFSMTALNLHSEVYSKMKKFKFYQDTVGEVTMNIVPTKDLKEEDILKLLREFYDKVGKGILFKYRLVDKINNGENGKYIFVEQRLDVERYNIC